MKSDRPPHGLPDFFEFFTTDAKMPDFHRQRISSKNFPGGQISTFRTGVAQVNAVQAADSAA